MFVCSCAAVDDREIHACIAGGARTVDEVGEGCFAGTGCGGCRNHIEAILATAGIVRTEIAA